MEINLAKKCPVCRSIRIDRVTMPYKTFRHLDFAEFKLASGNIICECSECGAVFRSFNISGEGKNHDVVDIENLYKSENYSEYREEHMVHDTDSDGMFPLSEVQANIITQELSDRSNIRGVLDIGCLDGKLLVSLDKRFKAERFLGFDVDQRAGFPHDLGIEFTQEPIDNISGAFDLILLSQSIMYIPDLQDLFKSISRLLTPQGIVFIQVPDLSQKPCAAILGDQYHYFSKSSIRSMLSHFNYECSFFTNTPFPKDILLFAEAKDFKSANPDNKLNQENTLLHEITSYLSSMADNIRGLIGESNNFAILGTTIDASFAYHLIPDRVLFFVDENPKKVGTTFLGKPVLHPQSMAENDVVIIPMGKSGSHIQDRFSKQYSGIYVRA